MWVLLAIALALGCVGGASAAEFCVNTSQQLEDALTTAATNGQTDVIKIAAGEYQSPGSGFEYNTVAPIDGDVNQGLAILGGWGLGFNGPCSLDLMLPTVLDGDNQHRGLEISSEGSASIVVRNLTFVDGAENGVFDGGGLKARGSAEGNIEIENCEFISNQAYRGGGMSVSSYGEIRIVNNLVADNLSLFTNAVNAVSEGAHVYFINNTVVNNTHGHQFGRGGVYIAVGSEGHAFVANNIMWGNEDNDFWTVAPHYRYNNSLGVVEGTEPVSSSGNLSSDPMLVDDYYPSGGSALIDAGRNPPFLVPLPVPFDLDWHLPEHDLNGQERVQGGRVDIGAFEAEPGRVFVDGFENGPTF